ncbi:hypothetical protein EE612_059393, partial [Oryza sativa]
IKRRREEDDDMMRKYLDISRLSGK